MRNAADVVAEVESAGNPGAMRFEPRVYAGVGTRFARACSSCARVNHCDLETAKVICATSWGKFQIMGFNLYGGEFPTYYSLRDFIIENDLQFEVFKKFCFLGGFSISTLDFSDDNVRLHFARFYNGKVNDVEYSERLRVAYEKGN